MLKQNLSHFDISTLPKNLASTRKWSSRKINAFMFWVKFYIKCSLTWVKNRAHDSLWPSTCVDVFLRRYFLCEGKLPHNLRFVGQESTE